MNFLFLKAFDIFSFIFNKNDEFNRNDFKLFYGCGII